MTLAAFALALGSAFLHALWNILLARERDPEPATAIAICTSVVVFAPVAAIVWDVDPRVWAVVAARTLGERSPGRVTGAALVVVGVALIVL